MTNYFCTLFDNGYLIKGMTMMESLVQWCPEAHVFVLCMDQQTQEILTALNRSYITCIPLVDIETPELLEVKKSRGVAEYCWTLSPCLPSFVLAHHPEIDFITYLDSDLLFYSPLRPIFDEIANSSIAIIEHRFAPRLQNREINGRFCVEWVSFRRDEEGMRCLTRWREQCIEWCYYRLEDGKMGDQKYLDEWPDLYPNCHIIAHPGAGIAPWNYEKLHFSQDASGRIEVDGSPLIFYHFHQFQLLTNGMFDRLSAFYTAVCEEPDAAYRVYERALMQALKAIRTVSPGFSGGIRPFFRVKARRWVQRHVPRPVISFLHHFIRY